MEFIRNLLNRIRWDEEFGKGFFELGIYDRVEGRITHISLDDITFEPGNTFSFTARDEFGEEHTIPFHRVREVLRNGELIWKREVEDAQES